MGLVIQCSQNGSRRCEGKSLAPRIATAFLVGAGLTYASLDVTTPAMSRFVGMNCNIKGNVSINTGEEICHVPGQHFYDETVIRPEYGERWFCSEAEARAAGWRKSRR